MFETVCRGPPIVRAVRCGKAYLALSSGGVYSHGRFAAVEHLPTYFTAILDFLGIGDVEVVRAEGRACGPEQDKAGRGGAEERICAFVCA